jgi:phosphate uptake regulator
MLVRRLSIIASTILSEAMQALLQSNDALAKEAINREDEADTIYYLAVRLLLSAQTRSDIAEQIGATDIIFIPAMRLMLQSLELISDYSEDVAKRIIELQDRRKRLASDVVEKICHFGDLAQTVFQKAVDCVFSRDLTTANSVLEMKNVLRVEAEEILRELPEVPYLRAIVISLNRIADMGGAIANIAVNRALEKPSKDGEKIFQMVKHFRTLPLPTKK